MATTPVPAGTPAPAATGPAGGTWAERWRQRRVTRRLVQLYAGLVLFGVSMAMFVRGGLGLMPWDVLHQGLSGRSGLTLGTVTILVGVLVLLLWIPMRERPGLGTVSNVLVIGLSVDAALAVLPADLQRAPILLRAGLVVGGVLLNAVATAAYIGARFGPGPRDGLMTGLVRRRGWSVRVVKTSIEITVVALGWLLGGTVGIGTLVYAFGVGPVVHVLLPRFTVLPADPAPAD